MADAALWAEAACSCLGWSTGSVLKLFLENQAEVLKHIVDSDPVATAVQDLMVDRADWEGNSTELLAALNAVTPEELHRSKEWPRSARSLSEKMRRAAPGIRMVGIGVDTSQRVASDGAAFSGFVPCHGGPNGTHRKFVRNWDSEFEEYGTR